MNAGDVSDSRKRDLRSAVLSYAKLKGQPPAAIALDLAAIRQTLNRMVPARAQVSRKRWANLRSDLARAIEASGMLPMLRTADLEVDEVWTRLLAPADQRVRHGLSRFVRWASLRRVAPESVDDGTIDRFITELDATTLIRNIRDLGRIVAKAWNALVELHQGAGLRLVTVPSNRPAPTRIPWRQLPSSFQEDDRAIPHLGFGAGPTRRGSAGKGASAAEPAPAANAHPFRRECGGCGRHSARPNISLASLVEPETFRALLRHRWQQDGRTLSAFTHGVGVTLTAIARDWVKAPAETIAVLKTLRSKLGTLPTGLTEKNQALLRKFDDPRLLAALLDLPDKLWRAARRNLATSRWPFIELQTALAIDILLHVPMRMQNLTSLEFDVHLHWPQGRRKPALLTLRAAETKNDVPLEFEIPTVLAERLQVLRNEIAPAVTGERPDRLFVTFRRHAENPSRDLSCDRENSPETSRNRDDMSPVPASRSQNTFGRQSWGIRTGEAAVGPQKSEDDHEILRRRQYAQGRTCACRAAPEDPRIQVRPRLEAPNTSAARGVRANARTSTAPASSV